MDLRSLIAKMDSIEQGLNEAFNINTLQASVGKISDARQRHAQVATLAQQNNLPGLYDPVDGSYVSTNGSTSNTAPHEVDNLLASKGLMPKNANTSTFLGKMFGTSGDQYDQSLRGQSDKVVADQTSAEFKATKFKELQDIMKQLGDLKKVDATPTAPTASAPAQQAPQNQAATPSAKPQSVIQNADGTFTLTKKNGTKFKISADGSIVKEMKESNIADSLIESFGYTTEAAAVPAGATDELVKTGATAAAGYGAGKLASKVLGRALPGVGTALSVKDAYDRWQAGDKSGAVISALAGAGWLIPGPLGWAIGGGLDAANIGRDFAGSSTPKEPAKPAKGQAAAPTQQGDPKIIALQKYLKKQGANLGTTGPNKDGVDGIMGPLTRSAMDAVSLNESQKMALLMLQLDQLNEANPFAFLKGAPSVGKEVTTATGDTFRWLGAQWAKVNPATGKAGAIASKDIAKELNSMSHGIKAIPGKVASTLKAHPKTAAGAAIAAGGVTGYMAGGDSEETPASAGSSTGGARGGAGATPAQPEAQAQVCSPEQIALIDKARGVMGELSDMANNDPALAQVLQTYQGQIDALQCSSDASGQGATPGETPLTKFYNSVGKK